jgi:surfeit locus 1 family protein
MLRGYSFRPRLRTFAAAALAGLTFVSLGNWQSRRGDEKRALALALDQAMKLPALALPAAPLDAAALVHRRVAARGRFVAERTVLLDNKLRGGRPGYEVVAPLRLGESPWHVLVNRGWIPAPASRETLPEVRTPSGEVRIEGIALERLPHALEAGKPPAGRVRQNVELEAFAAETGLQLEPLVIEQHSNTDDGLAREWPRVDYGIEKHDSYALQWYSLAGLSLVLAAALSFRRVRAP